jgi:ssDNA thymidine ADP-ribosyltransferase, DarT
LNEPPGDPAIYHITHMDNLPGVIREGCLWSDAQRIKRSLACTNIGYLHIKQRRLGRSVRAAAGGKLGEYVPFNFCNRSVMLYVIHCGHQDYQKGQQSVIHLVSSVQTAIGSGRPWAFTDRHAELLYARYYDDTVHLNKVDWAVMALRGWGGPGKAETKEKRQAEFLVHDWFPWQYVERIGVHNQKIQAQVQTILASGSHQPPVTVEKSWYY